MSVQEVGRLGVTVSLVAMFAFALIWEIVFLDDPQTRNLIIGALVGSFSTGAVQYWFGTTPQSAGKDVTIAKMADNQNLALKSTPPPAPPPKEPAPTK